MIKVVLDSTLFKMAEVASANNQDFRLESHCNKQQ